MLTWMFLLGDAVIPAPRCLSSVFVLLHNFMKPATVWCPIVFTYLLKAYEVLLKWFVFPTEGLWVAITVYLQQNSNMSRTGTAISLVTVAQ